MQFVLGSASCAFALCAFILWMRRCDGDRSRLTLSFVWMFLALLFSSRAFVDGQLVPSGVLPPVNLVGGLLMVTLLCLYPIEVIRPGWLNARRLFMLLLPAILIGVIFYLSGIKLRQLHTFGDMLAHIGEPNVYWRLILLFGIILPSALLLHVIPYNWMKSRVRFALDKALYVHHSADFRSLCRVYADSQCVGQCGASVCLPHAGYDSDL